MVNSEIIKTYSDGSASRPNTFMGTLLGHVIVTDCDQALVLTGEGEGLGLKYHIRERTRSERGKLRSQTLRGRLVILSHFYGLFKLPHHVLCRLNTSEIHSILLVLRYYARDQRLIYPPG
jgi:hypothetical protein